ncbi:hypothetical protein [Bradyrhizobium sp. AC87j1]|uniref:hypothetical protein n=1 Tax=Bradyrhizobium sp. AC87j1 TaxID=2055894 RepID=UPI00191BDAAC|nr:hypothetical protein [Bradyrhizobium sp. AC87j1]
MFKVSVLVWIMLGTALAGVSLIVVLMVPSVAADAIRNIPYAVAVGFALAMPLSYLVAPDQRRARCKQGVTIGR